MTYDILILGGGPGGYVAAIKAAQLGYQVGLVEKNALGGVCLNEGCIPTKTLLKNAKVYRLMKHASAYGIHIDDSAVTFNWTDMLSRKNKVIKTLTDGVKGLLKKNGVTVHNGYGEVLNPTTVKVGDETLTTKYLILATGASPVIPNIPGLKEGFERQFVYTYSNLLNYPKVPTSLTIIGGGVIGLEFATLFSSFGTKVTVIERLDQILSAVDDDVRQAYLRLLKKEKIEVITGASVTEIQRDAVVYEHQGSSKSIQSDIVLLSVGMKPNLEAFKALNLETTKHGVVVNAHLQTNIPNVYAIGDITGKMMLAHAASAEGVTAVEHISGKDVSFSFANVPSAIYGFPEIAWIGLTEAAAKADNIPYKTSKFPLMANGRSLAEGETDGFVKVVVNPNTGEIIGAHILASNASDLLAEVVLAIKSEATIADVANAIHLHPTVSETVMESALGAIHKHIHI